MRNTLGLGPRFLPMHAEATIFRNEYVHVLNVPGSICRSGEQGVAGFFVLSCLEVVGHSFTVSVKCYILAVTTFTFTAFFGWALLQRLL